MARKPNLRRRAQRSGIKGSAETFAADVNAWVRETDQRMVEVFRESARQLAVEVRGPPMPVVTGNLRNSLAASTTAMPNVDWTKRRTYPAPDGQIESTIAGATIGQKIWLGFQVPYATKVEAKYGFVRLTAQRWQSIVRQAVASVAGGGMRRAA